MTNFLASAVLFTYYMYNMSTITGPSPKGQKCYAQFPSPSIDVGRSGLGTSGSCQYEECETHFWQVKISPFNQASENKDAEYPEPLRLGWGLLGLFHSVYTTWTLPGSPPWLLAPSHPSPWPRCSRWCRPLARGLAPGRRRIC